MLWWNKPESFTTYSPKLFRIRISQNCTDVTFTGTLHKSSSSTKIRTPSWGSLWGADALSWRWLSTWKRSKSVLRVDIHAAAWKVCSKLLGNATGEDMWWPMMENTHETSRKIVKFILKPVANFEGAFVVHGPFDNWCSDRKDTRRVSNLAWTTAAVSFTHWTWAFD